MFHRKKLDKLKHFMVYLGKWPRLYNRYIFLEDTNDIVSIHEKPYETLELEDATGHTVSIVGSRSDGFPLIHVITTLKSIIPFNVKLFYLEKGWHMCVLLGDYDMNMVPFTNLVSAESLFPSTSSSNRLLVVNMEMIGTPTYFIDLFDTYLWIAFIISFTLIGLLSTLGIYLLQRRTRTHFDYLTWFSMITNQGGEENSGLIFPKVLLVILSVLSIIFHGSFEAFLSSYLAIRDPDLPFNNLYGLVKSEDFSICVPAVSTSYRYIENYWGSSVGLYHRLNDHHCPERYKQCIFNMQHFEDHNYCPVDKTVFFIPTIVEYWSNTCPSYNIIPLHEKYLQEYDTHLVSPGFKYREQFNRGSALMRTAGFIHRFDLKLKNMDIENDRRLGQIVDADLSIDFNQTKIILILPVVGIVLAIVILVFELIVKT